MTTSTDGKKPTKDVALANDARTAALWRSQGKDVQWILDNTSFDNPIDMLRAVREYNEEMAYYHSRDRRRDQYERMEALYQILSEAWDIIENPPKSFDREGYEVINWTAKINAMKVAVDVQKQLMVLQGLTKDDIKDVVAETLVVRQKQGEYVADLKTAIKSKPSG